MSASLAFVFPGQGSQSLGMLAELGAQQHVIIDTFAEASAALGYDLWALTQQGRKSSSIRPTRPSRLFLQPLSRSGACGRQRVVRDLPSLPGIASASIRRW